MSAAALELSAPTAQVTETHDDLFADVDAAIAAADHIDVVAVTGRHPSLVALCSKLHDIIAGRAAEELLADVDALPDQASLWVPPSWAWLFARVNVGRKDRAADGSRLRLPVRVAWSTGPIVLVEPGTTRTEDWSAAGLGHSNLGTVPVTANERLYDARIEATETGMPHEVSLPVLSRSEIITALQALVVAGATSRWEALSYLEPYTRRALTLAHSNVANELSIQWGTHRAVLDETKLESIASQMLLGDEEHPGKVTQMLERCLKAETFTKVEPLKYIKESLRRDANTEVRRAIGDPHIGTKIRKVARELGLRDLDDIIEAYRTRYPSDRLSKDRALAALSVAPDAMASWRELKPHNEG